MHSSPLLLGVFAWSLLVGGLTQPAGEASSCAPSIAVSAEDAEEATAVVDAMVGVVGAAAAPGASADTVAAAEADAARLMVSFNAPPGAPPQPLADVAYWGLPRPTHEDAPLTVGEPLELIGASPADGLDQIMLTAEVSNGPETQTTQFILLREEGEWRVLAILPATLDPAGCYLPAPPEMVEPPEGGVGDGPPVVPGGPVVVVTSSPVVVGQGESPGEAPPLEDPGGVFPGEPSGPLGLHVVDAGGSGPTSLAPHGGEPAWSPDGTRIAFSGVDTESTEPHATISVMNADGTGETALTDGQGWDQSPAWSPDGTRIAFLRQDWNALSSELYVVNADGSELTKLADAAQTYPYRPSWSPDGRMIAFAGLGRASDTSGRGAAFASDVWVVGADGSEPRQITDLPGEVTGPTWSPDGTRIAFADTVYEVIGPGTNALYVVNPDGTELTALTGWEPPESLGIEVTRPDPPEPEATAIQSNPAWSPDGRRIAFATIGGLAIIGADGADLIVLTVDELQVSDPVWSPDGTQLVFSGVSMSDEGYPDIYVVNPDGSGLTRVGGSEWEDVFLAWSPDGRVIAFTAIPPGN